MTVIIAHYNKQTPWVISMEGMGYLAECPSGLVCLCSTTLILSEARTFLNKREAEKLAERVKIEYSHYPTKITPLAQAIIQGQNK